MSARTLRFSAFIFICRPPSFSVCAVSHRQPAHPLNCAAWSTPQPPSPLCAMVQAILAAVPLPIKTASPAQSCTAWILAAIRASQDAGM
ncbi:hypothetical protein K432DRAFT_381409 [Lepidopterella palustris CBS 459.81]|uniref:Uncharacterized protein n=1 Tax=Lepidopterella palustris CBS 459.81 TaxID=1314670 RepID=A0A8E2ED14_9PEZI|nr:hypothetical protein K432DRAFT_381409 [Lepidopterella palustris CBS 459.81]